MITGGCITKTSIYKSFDYEIFKSPNVNKAHKDGFLLVMLN